MNGGAERGCLFPIRHPVLIAPVTQVREDWPSGGGGNGGGVSGAFSGLDNALKLVPAGGARENLPVLEAGREDPLQLSVM